MEMGRGNEPLSSLMSTDGEIWEEMKNRTREYLERNSRNEAVRMGFNHEATKDTKKREGD
jgi:hypothetical protein